MIHWLSVSSRTGYSYCCYLNVGWASAHLLCVISEPQPFSAVQLRNTKGTKNLKNTKRRLNLTFLFYPLKHRRTLKRTEDIETGRTQALPLHSPQNQRHCERSEAIRKDSLAIMVIMEMIHWLLLLFLLFIMSDINFAYGRSIERPYKRTIYNVVYYKCRVGFSPPFQRNQRTSACFSVQL